ncbi:MAG: FHA domain-containing protein [Myxococcota bacterium]
MPTSLVLQMWRAGQAVGQHQFNSATQRVVKIGRLSSAHVQIDHPDVSRVHAVIELSHNGATLIDMGSQSGTLINGAQITKQTLNHNDQVVIGDIGLLVGLGKVPVQPTAAATAEPTSAPAAAPTLADIAATATVAPAMAPAPMPAGATPAPAPPVDDHQPAPTVAPTPSVGHDAASRVAAKVAALPPDAAAAVEAFADFMAHRPDGFPASAPDATGGPDTPRFYDPSPARWHDPNTPDTDYTLHVNARKRRKVVVGVVAAIVAIGVGAVFTAIVRQSTKKELPTPSTSPKLPPPNTGGDVELVVADGAGTKTPSDVDAEPGSGTDAPPPEERDPNLLYVKLSAPRTLREISRIVWPQADHAQMLMKHNPGSGGMDVAREANTVVKIPRTIQYRVRAGDSLGLIAKRILGDSQLYPAIYKANRDVMSSPSAVEVGMQLAIPLLHRAAKERIADLGTAEPDP